MGRAQPEEHRGDGEEEWNGSSRRHQHEQRPEGERKPHPSRRTDKESQGERSAPQEDG